MAQGIGKEGETGGKQMTPAEALNIVDNRLELCNVADCSVCKENNEALAVLRNLVEAHRAALAEKYKPTDEERKELLEAFDRYFPYCQSLAGWDGEKPIIRDDTKARIRVLIATPRPKVTTSELIRCFDTVITGDLVRLKSLLRGKGISVEGE